VRRGRWPHSIERQLKPRTFFPPSLLLALSNLLDDEGGQHEASFQAARIGLLEFELVALQIL
jgi:hypothetical protein